MLIQLILGVLFQYSWEQSIQPNNVVWGTLFMKRTKMKLSKTLGLVCQNFGLSETNHPWHVPRVDSFMNQEPQMIHIK